VRRFIPFGTVVVSANWWRIYVAVSLCCTCTYIDSHIDHLVWIDMGIISNILLAYGRPRSVALANSSLEACEVTLKHVILCR
jgi:hypothetical protein